MGRKIKDYKMIIFDVDGTLYFQRKLRVSILGDLAAYHLLHFWRVRDLIILWRFRSMRSRSEFIYGIHESLENEQYEQVANNLKIPIQREKEVVEKRIYRHPLQYIKKNADRRLLSFIKGMDCKKCAFFSDYPARSKLLQLGIESSYIYTSTQKEINALKPNPEGILYILAEMGVAKADCIMIGDRDDRDGECARRAGIDYLILSSKRKEREWQYMNWHILNRNDS